MTALLLGVNPIATTNASGSFSVQTDGYVQGMYMPDPAKRFSLAGGLVALSETIPMWGSIAISENIPNLAAGNPDHSLGGYCSRATGVANLTGFTLFDQAHHMVQSVGSPVPQAGSGMSINFVRLGSGARIAVACDPALASLEGGLITQQVSWDFNGQQLVPFTAAWAQNTLTASSWASTGGGQVTFTTTSAHGVVVGSWFSISGATPAGYNGDYKAITGTTGSTLVAAQPTNPGTITAEGVLQAGGGALVCDILDINVGNSMTIVYSATAGTVTWNRAGSAALIQI